MIRYQSNRKKYFHFFIVIGGLAAFFAIAYFFPSQQSNPLRQAAIEPIDNEATISFTGVRHNAYQKGVKEWFLEADRVDYINDNKRAIFNLLKITFFQKKGAPVTVTADRGIWQANSNDLEVAGHVVITNEPYEMVTDRLTYLHRARKFVSDTPVSMTGISLDLSAQTMVYDLNNDQIYLFNDVEGTLAKNIHL